MTEEENKAIECLKIVVDDINECGAEYYIDKDILSDIKTALNLIEKLQKENEELRNTKNNCPQFNTSGVSCKLKQGDYIPKEKIRKLEDMWNDNIWNATDDESKAKAEMIRDVYRELLNE